MPRCRCRPPPPARRSARRARGERAPARVVAALDRSRQRRPCRAARRPHAAAPGARRDRPQPKRSAPSRRQATRLRLENGRPVSGSTLGSLRTRSSIGSMPEGAARARRSPTRARTSRGTRRARASTTASARRAPARRCVVRRLGAAYIMRVDDGGLLGELVDRRRLLDDVVGDRGQPTIAHRPPAADAGSSACGSP